MPCFWGPVRQGYTVVSWNFLSTDNNIESVYTIYCWWVTTGRLKRVFILPLPQEDDWQINEAYMGNISKYPKDWYKQITQKKKWTKKQEDTRQKPEKSSRATANHRNSKDEGKEAEGKPEDAPSEREEEKETEST